MEKMYRVNRFKFEEAEEIDDSHVNYEEVSFNFKDK